MKIDHKLHSLEDVGNWIAVGQFLYLGRALRYLFSLWREGKMAILVVTKLSLGKYYVLIRKKVKL